MGASRTCGEPWTNRWEYKVRADRTKVMRSLTDGLQVDSDMEYLVRTAVAITHINIEITFESKTTPLQSTTGNLCHPDHAEADRFPSSAASAGEPVLWSPVRYLSIPTGSTANLDLFSRRPAFMGATTSEGMAMGTLVIAVMTLYGPIFIGFDVSIHPAGTKKFASCRKSSAVS